MSSYCCSTIAIVFMISLEQYRVDFGCYFQLCPHVIGLLDLVDYSLDSGSTKANKPSMQRSLYSICVHWPLHHYVLSWLAKGVVLVVE